MARTYREPREPQIQATEAELVMGEWVRVSYRHWYYFDPSLFRRCIMMTQEEKKKEEEKELEESDIQTSDDTEQEEVEESGEDVEDETE